MTVTLCIEERRWPMREPFVIARQTITHQAGLVVSLETGDGLLARGEAYGVDYAGETPAIMRAQLEAVRSKIEAGLTRADALTLLPTGGARCALDAALWDLEAKRNPHGLTGVLGQSLMPVTTAFTIGMRSLSAYAETAARCANLPLLKVKVNADDPLEAIRAVRKGAPDAALIVDPNQAWSVAELKALAEPCVDLGVVLLEQPIAVGAEAGLEGWRSPLPLAADELINDVSDLDRAQGRFDVVNIKLDKCGGLTAALALADAIEARGMRLMVGCMAGSSLAMAPAMVLAQRCAFVDLDGPLLQSADWPDALVYIAGVVQPPSRALWG
ncbi:MAG: dipeptide epimerase [Erythrobacter sp.]